MEETQVLEKAAAQTKTKIKYLVRFNARQRIEHWVLMLTFIALSVTGLAEKFYTSGWGEWLIMKFGGIAMTRFIHRGFGILFVLTIVYHFAFLIYELGIKKQPATMMPTLKDVRNIFESLRYSFGLGTAHVQYPRYDYRQKFEYWGIIFGGLIMGASGLILMYPIIFTFLFPGEFVAAARTMHGNEALLAVLTIIIWHLYDTILKPDIFPLDKTIFTGKISEKRLEEEHSIEYRELMQKRKVANSPQEQAKP